MSNLLLLLFVLSLLGLVLGLIKPSWVLPKVINSGRGKAFLLYGGLVITTVILWAVFLKTATSIDEALADKENIYELDLGNQELTDLNKQIKMLSILERLILDSNKFTEVPAIIFEMPKLSSVDLSANPITELPEQLSSSTLYKLDLSNTQIQQIPPDFKTKVNLILDDNPIENLDVSVSNAIKKGDLTVSLKNTPYQNRIDQKLAEAKKKLKEHNQDESFWQNAVQRVFGSEYGTPRKKDKLTIYYKSPVTETEADSVASLLTSFGFGKDKYIDVQLVRDVTKVPALYKVKFVTESNSTLTDDVITNFKIIGLLISATLGNVETDIHICDGGMKDRKVITWSEIQSE